MVSPPHFEREKLDVYQCLFESHASRKEMLVRIVAMLTKLLMRFDPEQYRVHESVASWLCHSSTSTTTSTSTIDQGRKAIPGKSSQENKILTDCSAEDTKVGMD